jgi:signal transduction histidine kinase
VWGMIAVGRQHSNEVLPPETEARLAGFTELIATAISNAEARDGLGQLADEQAGLRRVATLVAGGATGDEVFAAVATEVREVLGVSGVMLFRYGQDGAALTLSQAIDPDWTAAVEIVAGGRRWAPAPGTLHTVVHETGLPARLDDYSKVPGEVGEAARQIGVDSSAGTPIIVNGDLWGLICVFSREGTLASDIEVRLQEFTELAAAAIANAQARNDLRGLAEEQAALRRVATLVAEGVPAEELFAAAAREVQQVLGVSGVVLDRYDEAGTSITTLALVLEPGWVTVEVGLYVGARFPVEPGALCAAVYETRQAARIDDYSDLVGVNADAARKSEVGSSCGAPIVVEGRLWGVMSAFSKLGTVLPAGTEHRLQEFAELVATAISNAANRSELVASRARIVTAGDEARRRIERNLHDGTQQRLIALGLDLGAVRASIPEDETVQRSLERVEGEVELVLEEVRELSRGLHPAMLARQGLGPSLRALARRCPLPVSLELELGGRPPAPIETCTYFVVSEALTNAVRYSQAAAVSVSVSVDDSRLHATIADDGVGGAEPGLDLGSGLIGLVDRVQALGGHFVLESPPGRGTRISIELPIGPADA